MYVDDMEFCDIIFDLLLNSRVNLVKKVSTVDDHAYYLPLNFDNSLDIEEWKKNLKIEVKELNDEKITFDVIGIDPPIANAIRRIMISEVPTVAIETVYIQNNTSILPDEILAHRLGLIPIKANPWEFEMRKGDEGRTDSDTIVFKLNVTCKRNPNTREDDPDDIKYENSKVYSRDLVWDPKGDQEQNFPQKIKCVYDDIPIVYLRPGQTVDLVCYCEKNYGREHAKWSPVATAFYRLLPHITLNEEISSKKAKELVSLCPLNVFDIEDSQLVVARPRDCTTCRECIRDPENAKIVNLEKKKDHFIFTVESTGVYKPQRIVEESMKILLDRIDIIEKAYNDTKLK